MRVLPPPSNVEQSSHPTSPLDNAEGQSHLHIGHEIHRVMLEKGKTVAWLAREYGCSRIHMYRIFDKPSLDTTMLMRFSLLLDYNFFSLYSQKFQQKRQATR